MALVEGHCDLLIVKGRILVALVLIRLGGSGLAFYKEHIVLFRPVLPHPGSKLSTVSFLDYLFFEEFSVKVLEFSQLIEPVGNRFNRSH